MKNTLLLFVFVVGCKTLPQSRPDGAVDASVAGSADASTDAALATRACAAGIGPKSPEAACDGRFTSDGHICAVCAVTAGCLAAATQVYCVASCADPACKRR